MSDTKDANLLSFTAQIVSAHLSNHAMAAEAIPELIKQTYSALGALGREPGLEQKDAPTPAVPIKRSVFPDYIVCLEDGKKLKMLKRHLSSAFSMTVEQYRERWGLPHDYPMVAPNYAERRSALAKEMGLGRKVGASAPPKAKSGRRSNARMG